MILLLDIGNTNTHLGLANARGVFKQADIVSADWGKRQGEEALRHFAGKSILEGAVACSVVPRATSAARRAVDRLWAIPWLELTARTVRGLGIDYPKPATIGSDRLANALAARHHFGAPCVAIGFGTAATFNVVDRAGNFVGGIIAPGLALMTRYLHEKTALLPEIRMRDTEAVIGKNTEEAMLIGALHGFRGLVRELVRELRQELRCRRLPVVATGGYAKLMAAKLPEITACDPLLTLRGLRLAWEQRGS